MFAEQDLDILLIHDSYIPLSDLNASQENLVISAPIWTYTDYDSGPVLITAADETVSKIDFTLSADKWNFIGTPDITDSTPYDNNHISLLYNSTTYNLSEAISNDYIGTLYYYDPDAATYETVAASSGLLVPWRAYMMKSNVSGALTVTK